MDHQSLDKKLTGLAKYEQFARLYRDVRMVEEYTKNLELVVFKGYQQEAQTILSTKLDKEIFDMKLKEERNTTQQKFEMLENKFKYLDNQLYDMRVDIQGIQTTNDNKNSESDLKLVNYDDTSSEVTADFESISKYKKHHIKRRLCRNR